MLNPAATAFNRMSSTETSLPVEAERISGTFEYLDGGDLLPLDVDVWPSLPPPVSTAPPPAPVALALAPPPLHRQSSLTESRYADLLMRLQAERKLAALQTQMDRQLLVMAAASEQLYAMCGDFAAAAARFRDEANAVRGEPPQEGQ